MLVPTGDVTPRVLTLAVLALLCCACGDGFETDPGPGPSTDGWSTSFGDDLTQEIRAVAVDPLGNVYVTGSFQGFTDFGGGSLEAAGMSDDVFIAKYSTDGEHVWSRRLGDESNQIGRSIAIAPSGEVVVAGSFSGSIDVAGQFLQASDQSDAFIVVLDGAGADVWGASFEGTGFDVPRSITVDAGGNLIVAGDFEGDINLGGEVFTSAGENDIFVAKLLPGGELVWARRFGSDVNDRVAGVAADSNGDLVVTGYLSGGGGPIDFGGGPLDPVGIDPNDDAYVVALGPDGAHRWSRRLGDEQQQRGANVCFDINDDAVFIGHFGGTIDFGGGEARTSSGGFDVYLVKLDAEGNPVWSRGYGVTASAYGVGVATDPDNNVSITGQFDGVVDFGGQELSTTGLTDVYMAGLDAEATHDQSMSFGDGDMLEHYVSDIAVDVRGNTFIVGNFYGSIDFGFGEHTSTGDMDQNPYIAKIPRQ